MRVHPSGYYAWKARPEAERVKENRWLLGSSSNLGWNLAGSMAIAKLRPTCATLASVVASIGYIV